MNKDLKIGYSGGSGGFLLLHLLLLTDQYYTSFKQPNTIDNIIKHQWMIHDHNNWKDNENWPDNDATIDHQTDLAKLYFFCNFNDIEWKKINTKSLFIYTDLSSQTVLAEYKKAHWFVDPDKEWRQFYSVVKAEEWPACDNIESIADLPDWIQEELFEKFNASGFTKPKKIAIPNGKLFDGVVVHEHIRDYLKSADYTIKLQDLVNTDGEILIGLLDIPPINDRQRDLIKHWRDLHDPILLKTIGIFC
jgi:hypothetical protein